MMNRKKAAILSLSLLTIISTDTVAPLVKQIGASFPQISQTIIKQTITLPSLMMIFFGLIAGQLVKVMSKKTILFIGLVLYSVGGIAAGWSQSFSAHLVLRAMLGAGTGLISPIITSLITDYFQGKERADLVGYSFALSHFMAVITPPLAAVIGAQNWRDAFWIYAIAPVVLVHAMIALPTTPHIKQDNVLEKVKTPIPPVVLGYSLAALVMMVFFFIIITDLPYLIETKAGISPIVSAFGLSVSTFGSTLAGLGFSRIYIKLKKWTIPIGLATSAIGFFMMTYSGQGTVVLIGLLGAGLGVGLLISLILLETANAVGTADSTAAVGVVNSAFSIGIFLSPFFYASLPRLFGVPQSIHFNFQFASIAFSLCAIFALLSTILGRKRSDVKPLE